MGFGTGWTSLFPSKLELSFLFLLHLEVGLAMWICCGAKLVGGCLHLAQTPAHPSGHWSGAASLFISPRQEIPPHTGFAPWVISWDRDSSHPSGEDMAFRNGLRVPKPTHSARQQENSVTGLVASKPCLGLFPLRSEQWGAAGWF